MVRGQGLCTHHATDRCNETDTQHKPWVRHHDASGVAKAVKTVRGKARYGQACAEIRERRVEVLGFVYAQCTARLAIEEQVQADSRTCYDTHTRESARPAALRCK